MSTGDRHTFIAREFRYRSAESVILLAFLLAVAAGCASCIHLMEGAWVLLPTGLACSFLILSVVYSSRILRDRRDACVIDEEGIRVGELHWEWSDVQEVYADGWPTKPTIDVQFTCRGGLTVEEIPFRPRLTPAEYEALIASLREAHRFRNTHVRLGGYRMGAAT